LGEVETVCDQVAILCDGELKVEGRVSELVKNHGCGNLEQVFLKIIGAPMVLPEAETEKKVLAA
jgi:ABC-type Na+ transport system ATPase subunit NatA